ncbi:MAG: SPOR domain-containing protein [Halofilum sp. (in: g-proteobacteria)]|nr:SPOR domain-containing protein [Halofilum sp. (in: g-proteobacteria)]
MRWVALLLLVANAAFAGWILSGTPGREPRASEPPVELGELPLLRESRGDGSAASVCFTIGPFEEEARAEAARQRLAQLDVAPRQRTTRDEEVYGYQVLLPPFGSREAALAATRELQQQGIEDYFIVSGPELENAVSVGLFERKRFAVRHADYLNDLGFDAELRLRTRERTRYWQDYRDPRERVTSEVLDSLSAEQALKRLERPCD